MGQILPFTKRTGFDTVTIDLVKAEGGPAEAFPHGTRNGLRKWLSTRSDRSLVQGATLRVRYDLTKRRPAINFSSVQREPLRVRRGYRELLAARTFWPTSTVGGGRSDLSTSLVSHARGGDSGGRVGRQISWSCRPAEKKIRWSSLACAGGASKAGRRRRKPRSLQTRRIGKEHGARERLRRLAPGIFPPPVRRLPAH